MGVYINGMMLPSNCSVCPLRMEQKDGSCGGCRAESIWYGPEDDWKYKARPNWCPLVPVPPHGRLIDIDAPYQIQVHVDGLTKKGGVDIYAPTVLDADWAEEGET